ncbi:CYTH and CHAD domain-containing protein [Streptomyces sp. NRRL S-350]|uniref:CYTH and CHAD domain-containing protein n=1 Tax=Streptomyces sp. NRRL S-350 TaxID=1463902 RepID=UPI0004C0AAAF|nr:CYTH and CHAD domain-containing protein [Streptomyces sp. NRRL S-350]
MGTQHAETERKYDGAALPERLDRVPGVATAQRAESEDLDAVYYDTPDLRLLRRRITLRRRTGGNDAGWHLKLPRTDDVRQEVRLPVEAGGPGDVPAELAQLVAAFTRGGALAPVAHLRTHRSQLVLRDDRGDALARITEDRVAAHVLDADRVAPAPSDARPAADGRAGDDGEGGPPGGTTTEVRGWTEFEVELEHGTPALLDRVEAAFTDAGLVRSPWPSKLSRALGERRAAAVEASEGPGTPRSGRSGGPASTPAAGSAGALVMDGFRSRLDALLTLDAAVRRGEADSVHRMRVAARTLRSLLKAHRRLFKGDRAQTAAAELQWLGRLLGRARDREVLGDLLVGGLDAVPAQRRGGALRGRLAEHYAKEYRAEWQRAVAELDGDRYFALLDRLDAFAADPPLRHRADRDARGYVSDALRREQRRTTERLDRALRSEPGPLRDQALHGARKAAKRARYTADHAQSQLPRRAARRVAKFGGRMKKLHKVLGTHQDSVVARAELITLAGQDAGGERDAFAYGVLHEQQRHIADAARRRLPKLRRRAGRRKLTRLP